VGPGGPTLLNIGRMAPGSHDYYLSVVAAGAEDYYLARGEAPGRWLGRGIEPLGLEGPVEAEPLRRVLAGADPSTGARLAAHPARKVPGFDLTFRAPKSVSLLWGLGDETLAEQVREAHDAAVGAAVGFIEREVARTRRGAGGRERVEVDGLIAAAFRHRTSRAGDPLLHTHVLVANLARTSDDGVWRTLESRRLFMYAKTAGYLYQAHLRWELTRGLGVAWEPVTNGYADIAGIPRDLIDGFSRRRQQILQRLDEVGETSARAAQVATLETRVAKEGEVSEAELRGAWTARAEQLGYDPARLRTLVGQHEAREPDAERLVDELVTREELTAHSSTFARRDLLQAVAERLPDGDPVEQVEQLADEIITRGREQLVALGPRRDGLTALTSPSTSAPEAGDELRMTTWGLLLVEQHTVNTALNRRSEGVNIVPAAVVDQAITAAGTLAGEQAEMVRRLTQDGDGVTVVVGRAGTGKTFALSAAHRAWRAAGVPVHGAALAARAALELEEASGIPSMTVHRLLTTIDARPGSPLAPGSVLVVDEAGMVGTRTLARLLDHAARQQVKVVLVGDRRQLPEVDAGGLFTALARRLDPVELTENRRQRQAWEQTALDELRDGDVDAAVADYARHGRMVTADTAEAAREQLVADWWETTDLYGATSSVMVALRHSDVSDLNARARQLMTAAGMLTGPALEVDGLELRAGDRVVCLRNDSRLSVVNGLRGQVTHVDVDDREIEMRADDGRSLRLPSQYLDAGHVTHGYAITGHKAQGLTVDRTFVLATPDLYREWGYVALSRGRHDNRLYLHTGDDEPDLDLHQPPVDHDPVTAVTAALRRSRAEQPLTDATASELVDLGARWRHAHARHHQPDVTRQRELAEQHDRLVEDRAHAEDSVQRLAGRLDEARRGLGRLRNRDHINWLETDLTHRQAIADRLDTTITEVEDELAALPSKDAVEQIADEYREVALAVDGAARRLARRGEHHPPGYLPRTIGAPPADPDARDRWREAARAIEQYRIRWAITDPHRPLGDEPTHPAARRDHQRAVEAIAALRDAQERERQRGRGLGRGLSRSL
jgi:Ti-type conjugative transfer relaxase TraA